MLMLRTKFDGWLSLSPKEMAESCASEKKLVVADQKKKKLNVCSPVICTFFSNQFDLSF